MHYPNSNSQSTSGQETPFDSYGDMYNSLVSISVEDPDGHRIPYSSWPVNKRELMCHTSLSSLPPSSPSSSSSPSSPVSARRPPKRSKRIYDLPPTPTDSVPLTKLHPLGISIPTSPSSPQIVVSPTEEEGSFRYPPQYHLPEENPKYLTVAYGQLPALMDTDICCQMRGEEMPEWMHLPVPNITVEEVDIKPKNGRPRMYVRVGGNGR